MSFPHSCGHPPSLTRHDERGIHEPDQEAEAPAAPVHDEFKAELVRIVRTSGKSVDAVARELDLTETCLRSRVQQAEIDANPDPRGALTTHERAELVRLRRELRTVEQERDFLKSGGVLRQAPVVKYVAIAACVAEYPVSLMCRALGVAPAHSRRRKSPT